MFQIGHPKCPKARGSSVRPSPWVPKPKCPQTKLPCCVVCLSWGKHGAGGWGGGGGVGGARYKGAVLLPTEGRPWLRSRLVLLPTVAPGKRWLCWQEAWTTPPHPTPTLRPGPFGPLDPAGHVGCVPGSPMHSGSLPFLPGICPERTLSLAAI